MRAQSVTLMAILALVAACGPQAPTGPFAAVDEARLVAAESEPGQWMSTGRTYSEQRFSPLDQINEETVDRLGLAWFADFDTNRGQQATPIAVDGVIYVSTAWSKVYAFDARTADEGRSAFSARSGKTRLGEQLFDERINLYSDPMHAEMPAAPSTNEGIPATRLSLIKGGVVEHLVSSRFWAREQKREPSPGPVNYIMESSQPPTSMDDMIKNMTRGLVISRFWYVRLVDPRTIILTGLTRDGLWWVENGQIRHPVRNLRFNQSVLAMLAPWNVEAIGAPQRLSPFMVPALKLGAFTFTSISDAI